MRLQLDGGFTLPRDCYHVPKAIFGPEYKGLTNDARILYGLLLDRFEADTRLDDRGEPYLIYKREDMQVTLGVSERTVQRTVGLLRDYSLITETRQGLALPNMIYLLIPDRLSDQ